MRLKVILIGLALLTMLALPASSHATTLRTEFTWSSGTSETLTPGTRWMDGTLLYTRGMVQANRLDSDNPYVDGLSTVTINFQLDVVTGNGVMWGKEVLQPDAFPGGGYTCSWTGKWTGWTWAGTDKCHGYGDLEGLMVVYFIDTRFTTMTGYVMDPGS